MNLLVTGISLALLACGAPGTAAAMPDAPDFICTRHLMTISDALKEYNHDHEELPPHLSDLYPQYLPDKALLFCPSDPSPGTGAFSGADDPQIRHSYLYQMSTNPNPFVPGLTWRQSKIPLRARFGDAVPVVSCYHHPGLVLHLTLGGQVYRGSDDWAADPWAVSSMLTRMQADLSAGPAEFVHHWDAREIETGADRWIDGGLSPALRGRLGAVADQLFLIAKAVPAASQGDVYCLAARFYAAAGRTSKAIEAGEEALRRTGEPDQVRGFLADLRYRAGGKRGAPPIDVYLKGVMAKHHIPGTSVAVVRAGKILLTRGYGLAHIASSVPVTKDTVYPLASVTKLFTAIAMMRLVRDGRLSLDDPITRYLPEARPAWDKMTVRHVFSHTSGIVNLASLPEETPPDQVIRKLAAIPLDFEPGTKWAYSNEGYGILKRILERASGKPYGELLSEQVFQPLGMTSTSVDLPTEVIPNRATGYTWKDGALREINNRVPTWFMGAGGLVSTIGDMAKWGAALQTEKLISQATLEQIWATGDRPGSFDRRRMIWGGGGLGTGISALVYGYTDEKVMLVFLANRDGIIDLFTSLANWLAGPSMPLHKRTGDPDPTTTRRLREIILRFAEGKAATDAFTPAAQIVLQSELQQVQALYRSLGPLRSFRLIEQKSEKKNLIYRYRAVFGNMQWIQSFTLTPGGKIEALEIEPG
jgi:D-alanyl-D-alanine carboxypeptidase